MLTRLTRCALVAGLSCLVALPLTGCAETPQPEFVSLSDRFAVQFHGAPQVKKREVAGRPSAVFSVDSADGADTVAVTELPAQNGEPAEMVPWVLNSAKNDLVTQSQGKITSESSPVLAGKYPGREFTAAVTDPHPGVLRARIYYAHGRIYQVVVMGTADYANSERATAFLDSFRITE